MPRRTASRRALTIAVLGPLMPVAARLPKDRRLVLFGAMNGRWYGDNSRHLYEWALANRPELRPVWVSGSAEVHRSLRAQGRPSVRAGSWRAVLLLWRAGAGVFCNSLSDLTAYPQLLPDSLPLLALRHGRSVKRVRFARQGHVLSVAEAAERRREGRLIRQVVSTSEFVSDLQEECLQIGRDKHVVTGYPRNDCLLDVSAEQQRDWLDFLGDARPARVVLYAPSWRHGREPTRFFPFPDFDVDGLVQTLRDTGTLLLLRPHAQDLRYAEVRRTCESLAAHADVVRLATHELLPDVNRFLPFVDVLVSDYSALYHDFLLLDRPMVFVPYDYAEFEQQNGFLYDYPGSLPGPAVGNQAGLCRYLNAYARGEDTHRAERRALRDRIHTYQDGHSCDRVGDVLDRMLEGRAADADAVRRHRSQRSSRAGEPVG